MTTVDAPHPSIRVRLRAGGASIGTWVRQSNYLQKWLVLGTFIGIIAGLGAVVFYTMLRWASELFLGGIGGYFVPQPAAEDGFLGTSHFPTWWLIPIIVCLGGLLSGIIVYLFAPEAEGHGTNAAIDAVHRNPRMIRSRAVIVKMVASAITIGSGGSGGREGPTAQISAGFGSLLARTLNLSPEDGRIAVSIGIGSGIGAIFGAPLGGAVLAADIVYRDDFEVEALIPGLISSIVGYTVWGLFEGFTPMFGYVASNYRFDHPVQLLWFAVIGVLAGFVGLLYAKSYYSIAELSKRIRVPSWLRPAIGGLAVGLLALAIPQVLGTGYGWAQQALGRSTLLAIPLWIVLALPFAKILATSLSIGTGGSGGIFGPGTVIGGFVGCALWRLVEPLGASWGVPHSPAPFVIVGMMACFGGIARAPLAMMLMVAEMTGSLTILAPAMVSVGIAYLIVRRKDATIYRSQLRNREEAQSARLRLGLPLLSRVAVAEAAVAARVVLTPDVTVADAIARLEAAAVPGAPIVDVDGRFRGTVSMGQLRKVEASDTPIERCVDATAATVSERADLGEAIDALPEGYGWLTVLDDDRRVGGILAIGDIVRAYHAALRSNDRRMAQVSADSGITYIRMTAASPLAGHTLAEHGLPNGVIVLSVRRADEVLLAAGSVQLEAGDLVSVLAPPDLLVAVRTLLAPV
ncbi:MAG: chloride channel protein [Lacisediminihabitans sp.]